MEDALTIVNGPEGSSIPARIFTAHIRNPNTRRAYLIARWRFADWCGFHEIPLAKIEPMVVAAYVKQHLAAIRMLFDWLVVGQIVPSSAPLLTWGPFPRPALPGVSGHTDPSATLPARPAPHGGPVDACKSPTGLPVLPRLPSSMHAGATTPAGAVWCTCRFTSQTTSGLPLTQGGSAPVLPVSRPARRSLHAPAATSRKDSCWVGFAPTRKTRLSTAH